MNSFPTWISQPLARLSLRSRLSLGFALALLGTGVLMGVALWGAQRAGEAVSRMHDVEFPVEEHVLQIRIELLEARRYEKEFLLRWREMGFAEAHTRYVNLLRASLAEIPPRLAEIDRLQAGEPKAAEATQLRQMTGEIGREIADYQRDFLAMTDLIGRLGHVDGGLEGEFRRLAHSSEALIPADAPALHAGLLQMRRLEKDYLLRGRSQDAAALDQAVQRFHSSLDQAAIAAPLRTQLLALNQAYREKFATYVRVSDEIDALRRRYLLAAARTEAPLQQIERRANERLDAIHAQAISATQRNNALVLTAGTLALLLGLLTALTLSRSILLLISQAVAFAEKIAAGDLTAQFVAPDDDEFARLAQALRHMTKGLQHARDQWQTINAELEQRIAQRTLHLRAANRGLSERTHEMALLAELTEWLLVGNSRSEAYRMIGIFFTRLFPLGAGRLYLRRGASDTFAGEIDWGSPRRAAPTLTVQTCLALRQGLSQCTCDGQADAATCIPPREQSPAPAALCIPLVSQSETFGLIYLELPATGGMNGDRIDPADKMLTAIVVKQLALGLENLRLREALLEQATRDALTGLYNRRYLEETLTREIERARRQQGTLAAIMLDVDFFKRFNDNYGHEAGDVVLAAIGRLLGKNIRASDVACRYGGEEFTILLPDTDAAQAAERAELIRRAAHEMVLEYDKKLPAVTLSLGVAEFPLHGETGATLLAAADAALYRAKENGRDRVEVAK